VAHVRLALHGQPAHVDARLAVDKGDEVADLARGGVVEPESHPPILGFAPERTRIPEGDVAIVSE
jgi:hypothetical protein